MKKTFFVAVAGLLLASCSKDDGSVSIQVPKDFSENTLVVSHVMLDNIFAAKQADDVVVRYDTLEVKNGEAKMKLDAAGAAWYTIIPSEMVREQPEFYAVPGDKLEVVV
ncbi:MAG: hypothetical protein K2J78_02280, partial [Muribaculaceae bacterium]|nr:hypothetical protein [Muribaculaceae bacterium]